MTTAQRTEAIGWVEDCEWGDEFDARRLSDAALRRGIDRHYCGGWAQFLVDTDTGPVRI